MKKLVIITLLLTHVFAMTSYVSALQKSVKNCKCDTHEAGHEHEDCDCGMCDMKHAKIEINGKKINFIAKFFLKNPPCHKSESNYIFAVFNADLYFTGVKNFYQKEKQTFLGNHNLFNFESNIPNRLEKPS
ncbi:MAG: hypothetical protein OEZ22_01010 [Spirochaetia bacterium]|nr:hypothetical protein [Spirochaetia bacterium]